MTEIVGCLAPLCSRVVFFELFFVAVQRRSASSQSQRRSQIDFESLGSTADVSNRGTVRNVFSILCLHFFDVLTNRVNVFHCSASVGFARDFSQFAQITNFSFESLAFCILSSDFRTSRVGNEFCQIGCGWQLILLLAAFFLLVLLSPKRFPDAGQMVFLFPCVPVFISGFQGALLMSAPTS